MLFYLCHRRPVVTLTGGFGELGERYGLRPVSYLIFIYGTPTFSNFRWHVYRAVSCGSWCRNAKLPFPDTVHTTLMYCVPAAKHWSCGLELPLVFAVTTRNVRACSDYDTAEKWKDYLRQTEAKPAVTECGFGGSLGGTLKHLPIMRDLGVSVGSLNAREVAK